MEANSTSMTEANVSTNVVDYDNATITVKVESGNDNTVTTCTYDLVWVWDSDDVYTTPDVTLPYTHTDKVVYPYELSVKVDDDEEKDLSLFTWNGKEAVIAKKSIISNDNELTYSIDVQIYNIPVVQTKLFNKKIKAHIEIRNNVCTSEEKLEDPPEEPPEEPILIEYWNASFDSKNYEKGKKPNATYASVSELRAAYGEDNFASKPYFVKTTMDGEHVVCIYYNEKEFCLGRNYWEKDAKTTKNKLKADIKETLGSPANCHSDSSDAYCIISSIYCYARANGSVSCEDSAGSCGVSEEGSANCY